MNLQINKNVDAVDFAYDGKDLTACAQFVINVTIDSADPEPGFDIEASDYYVALTDVMDTEGNDVPDFELRTDAAEEVFNQTTIDLHEEARIAYEDSEC
ncbi:MAG: hypothetical protein Tp1124DCM412911_25 [Prokaryotic dsDNA virus sp.]|nr:MAG: hypothetical protein Tp1124DCM412911_25 [Prokaryotic dsDNA virus sp.]|tara:strand:+ start:31372 stop:31668 length:297 start_codon:yes stop_codon:yes gene_type:complete